MGIMWNDGRILFTEGGLIAMHPSCCCTFFPCCSEIDVSIVSDTEYEILNDDPNVLSNGWILQSETLRPDGLLDVHCFIVACNEPPGSLFFYIQTKSGVLDPVTRQVTCLDEFIADEESGGITDTISLEGETGDDLSGRYTITAVCTAQTACAYIAERNTDGDLDWIQISGDENCSPPSFPPTTEGQIVLT